MGEAVFIAADANEFFDMRIPGGYIGVADGPVDGEAVAEWGIEFEIAETLGLAVPEEATAADLVAADPVEWFLLYIGMLGIFDEEVSGGFSIVGAAGGDRIFVAFVGSIGVAMGEFPRPHGGGGIIL